ncbi:MAG TPA: DUF2961 domain-containing protein [Candidatus Aminicenantes bacterium]|nr:DUF2961 domain-containing protein [Candidatus Aminicenantes bacterium]
MRRKAFFTAVAGLSLIAGLAAAGAAQSLDSFGTLGRKQDFVSKRISSYDRTGGNRDFLTIEPGQTAVLADIKGPAAIHHIWTTISAEPFYGRKLVLRIYWDGEDGPSVEAPIGDFFGVGHGLDRNLRSLPIACTSEGRARNCYWYMPFRWSAQVTVTNEGVLPVNALYYYIDYRELADLNPDDPYFHAQYRQEMPCEAGKNYILLDASGRGHYVGANLSVLQRADSWWGEGDDMIYVDGEAQPSLHGTGSEDYFSDAWGMREDGNLFYGCPLQEEDFQMGSKATVYRFHIPDPIPFKKSIRVTLEHGHANDRSDYYSSVAYWYQTEPHAARPALPPVEKRLPYAFESTESFKLLDWEESLAEGHTEFLDKKAGIRFKAPRLARSLTSYYSQTGERYAILSTEGAAAGTKAELSFPVETGELYNINLFFLKAPSMGAYRIYQAGETAGEAPVPMELGILDGYSQAREIKGVEIKNVRLKPGENTLVFEVTGKNDRAEDMEVGFVGIGLAPAMRRFITDWNVIGPFAAPGMDNLQTAYPPEAETALNKKHKGRGDAEIAWKSAQAEGSGFVRLAQYIQPSERVVAYGLVYVHSPDDRETQILLGSDDGVRLWVNDTLVHSNAVTRSASPDQDRIAVALKTGWNKLLIKVLQGAGGWGFYLRVADPDLALKWALQPGR